MKLCIIDTETGGLDPQTHSLLSLGAVMWEDGIIGDQFEVFLKQPSYHVTPTSLKVNNMDLRMVINKGVEPSYALNQWYQFIVNAYPLEDRENIVLAGWNVMFDIGYLKMLMKQVNGVEIGSLVAARFDDENLKATYHQFDIASVVRFLNILGLCPTTRSEETFKHFGVTPPQLHTALGDCITTANLLNKLMDVYPINTVLAATNA